MWAYHLVKYGLRWGNWRLVAWECGKGRIDVREGVNPGKKAMIWELHAGVGSPGRGSRGWRGGLGGDGRCYLENGKEGGILATMSVDRRVVGGLMKDLLCRGWKGEGLRVW